jgi:hypothetical protein
MDRRESAPEESGFLKDLKAEEVEYDDKVDYRGKTYRVPYRMIREVVFSNLDQSELQDMEHSARLQYRLLLLDSVIKAKVEFVKNRITITYNPPESKNRKEKINRQQLAEFLAKEGVYVDPAHAAERDVNYFEEIYRNQFEPATIREHAPYGYSLDEWRSMKPGWEKKRDESLKEKYSKFQKWQDAYLESHPDLAKEYGGATEPKDPSAAGRSRGKRAANGDNEHWFHGI